MTCAERHVLLRKGPRSRFLVICVQTYISALLNEVYTLSAIDVVFYFLASFRVARETNDLMKKFVFAYCHVDMIHEHDIAGPRGRTAGRVCVAMLE